MTVRVFPRAVLHAPEIKLKNGPNGGRLYTSPAGTFEVYGAILDKYRRFGGPRSVLGFPVTDERGTPDGVGRYNHFQGGSIYWTPTTGAHVVYGAIRERWEAIGWELSYLGYPLSDEEAFDEGGRVSQFQGGQIYWWPDTGAIDLSEVVVSYAGLVCFEETTSDQSSDSDEPYVIFGVLSPAGGSTLASQVYEPGDGIDDGDWVRDRIELFRGKPGGLVLSTTVMEHDYGDPNAYKKQIEDGVKLASSGVSYLVTLIPVVGPILGAGAGAGLVAPKGDNVKALQRLFDFGDERIGQDATTLTPKQMIVLAARTPEREFKSIGLKVETRFIKRQGASYKVYFSLATA